MFIEVDAVKKVNLYEIIADEIEKQILSDTIQIGEKLPAEQQLADSFRVSRNVVREAFKILKERGLLKIRNGEGAYIASPKPKALSQMVNRIVSLNRGEILNMYEMRCVMETGAVKLAVTRIKENEICRLEEIVEKMKTVSEAEAWGQLDMDFHTLIVGSTGNDLISSFYIPVLNVLREIFVLNYEVPGARRHGLDSHVKIIAAFRASDVQLAVSVMEEHVQASKKDILTIV